MQETDITHIYGDHHMTVYAGEQKWRNRIRNLKERYPEDVEIVAENPDGSFVAHVPFRWLRISKPVAPTLTDEQRTAAIERLRMYRECHNGGGDDDPT